MVVMDVLFVLIVLERLPNVRMFWASREVDIHIDDYIVVLVFLNGGWASRLEQVRIVVAVSALSLRLRIVRADSIL